ncbi:MAG: MarR family winged helix-turn-helix transcriptional regulator [Candidatus Zixiibacteriota bacterium]
MNKNDKIKYILNASRDFQQYLLTRTNNKSHPKPKHKPLLRDISGGQVHLIRTAQRMLRHRQDGLKLKELCDELGVTPASASSMVDRLVKKGILVRKQDPNDRRSIRIILSDKLQREFHHQDTMMNKNAEEIIRELDDEVIDKWQEVMEAVISEIIK